MHIVFYPRVPTSEERKKERKKEREPLFQLFFQESEKKNSFHSIFKILLLFVINKTRFYTHAGIEHPHEFVLSLRDFRDSGSGFRF